MPKANKLDSGQICFESDSMQVLSLSRKKSVLELPLTKAPINFAVLRSDGLSSNRWGVNTNKNGDAYVYCRAVALSRRSGSGEGQPSCFGKAAHLHYEKDGRTNRH